MFFYEKVKPHVQQSLKAVNLLRNKNILFITK